MATVVTGFAILFIDMGLGAALIQARNLDAIHYSSVFWLNLAAGLLLCVATVLAAPLAARFFSEPRLELIMTIISTTFIVGSLTVVQRARLVRDLQFKRLAGIEVSSVCVAATTAIAAAYAGLGVWALVLQQLVTVTTSTILQWSLSAWRPSIKFDRAAIRTLLPFSANLLGFSAANYWIRNVDNLLIGRILGPAPLGIYNRAYAIMLLPTAQISQLLGGVMFPMLARIQHEPLRIKRAYQRSLRLIALLAFPMMLGLAATPADFVSAVYGDGWVGVTKPLRFLCLVGAMQSVASTVGWIYRSQGRTDVMLRWSLLSGAFLIASMMFGIWLGSVETVALCYAIATGVLFFPSFAVPGRLIGLSVGDVVTALWRPAGCALIMAGVVTLLDFAVSGLESVWGRLGIKVTVGIVVYAALVLVAVRDGVAELKALTIDRFRRGFARREQPG